MTGLLLITHGSLGDDMLNAAKEILSACPLAAEAIAVDPDCDPDQLLETAGGLCEKLDDGGGVLVLTDLYGSTPSNIANRLIDTHNARVISGANLPMLLRILNYPDMDLKALCEKAANGAREGIVVTSPEEAS
ncbi:MAG: PTS sugar transporter subunit IIA [Gammaproteobacteria bacterium]|jgi:PTS system ascorbate-specific IIA component